MDSHATTETRAENSDKVEPNGNKAMSAVSPGAIADIGALINQRPSVISRMAYPNKPILPRSADHAGSLVN